MSDVLFGQSYFLRFDPKLWRAMQPYPPLGSIYAASYVRAKGYDVALFDAMLASSEAEWEDALQREKPRFAVLFEDNFNYLSKMCLLRMRQAATTMLGAARQAGCTVIAAGADATDHAQDYLAAGAHIVLLNEGEETLGEVLDLLKVHSGPLPLAALRMIPGLAFADPDAPNVITHTPRRPDIKDLDSLPFPAWDLVDIGRYKSLWYEHHGYFAMNMVTTRGCPFHCNWCAKPIWGQRYHSRSPENVVAELALLKTQYQPDQIAFVDDIFGLRPGWIKRFADLVEQQEAKIPYRCLTRVDLLMRSGEVDAFQRSGCRSVWVGAESGSQKILDAMEKGTRVEQIYAATRELQRVGVEVGFFLQFGYPGETRADIDLTFKMVRECRPDDIGMSVSYPLPGTKFHAAVQAQLGTQRNWQDSEDLAMLYSGTFTTSFYRQLHRVLHAEFRMRKHWSAVRTRGPKSQRGRLGNIRPLAAAAYHWASLSLARRKLERLAQLPAPSFVAPLQPLSPEAAAQPSPQ